MEIIWVTEKFVLGEKAWQLIVSLNWVNLNQGRSYHCVGSANVEALICWAGFYILQ